MNSSVVGKRIREEEKEEKNLGQEEKPPEGQGETNH